MSSMSNETALLKGLNCFIEDGNMRIQDNKMTSLLKKEKIQYQKEFNVSINPKKDATIIKNGTNEIYCSILSKLLNSNISLQTFNSQFSKNKPPATPKSTPKPFNPIKLPPPTKFNIDFPEPLQIDKMESIMSQYENTKIKNKKPDTSNESCDSEEVNLSKSEEDYANYDFSRVANNSIEETTFSDYSLDMSIDHSSASSNKKEGLEITFHSQPKKSVTQPRQLNLVPPKPKISLATCFDDNSTISSASSDSSIQSSKPHSIQINTTNQSKVLKNQTQPSQPINNQPIGLINNNPNYYPYYPYGYAYQGSMPQYQYNNYPNPQTSYLYMQQQLMFRYQSYQYQAQQNFIPANLVQIQSQNCLQTHSAPIPSQNYVQANYVQPPVPNINQNVPKFRERATVNVEHRNNSKLNISIAPKMEKHDINIQDQCNANLKEEKNEESLKFIGSEEQIRNVQMKLTKLLCLSPNCQIMKIKFK